MQAAFAGILSRTILATVALSAAGDMERADLSAALYQGNDGALIARAIVAALCERACRLLLGRGGFSTLP